MVLYRGVTEGAMPKLKVGDEFSDKAFVSTSSNMAVARGFSEADNGDDGPGYVIKIFAPKGANALIIDSSSKFPNENEILLQAGSKFSVIHISKKTSVVYVRLIHAQD